MEIRDFQELIGRTFLERDRRRGLWGNFAWLVEEVGELSRALRSGDDESLSEEFADVLAWLASLANVAGVDLESAARKYASGCPRCGSVPCACP